MLKRSICFVVLLLMLWSSSTVASNLCTTLNGLARKPLRTTVDGFIYDFFSDVSSWISTPNCNDSSSSVDWTSDWIDVPSLIYSSNGASGKGGKVQYHVKGNANPDSFSASAIVSIQMNITKGSLSNPAMASFGFDAKSIPVDLSGRFAPIWQGSLKTTGSSGLGVYDDDLFDGAGAFVVDDCSGSFPSQAVISQMEAISRLAVDVNQRFRNFEAVPTALSGDVSARLAFPLPGIIDSVTESDIHLNGSYCFAVHGHGECRGDECGPDASRTLMQLAGADTVCQSPTIITDSIYGSLHTTLSAVGTTDVSIIGVRGTVQAVFSCSQGYVGITLDAVADPDTTVENRFSQQLFSDDTRAAISQIKAIPMIVSGRRYGFVTRDNTTIMTPVETDMFAHGRGGAFVDDVVITDSVSSQFQSAVATIQTLLNSKYPVVNDVYSSLFSNSSAADIVKRYFAQVAHPTSYGLWSYWAEQFNGFAVARDTVDNQLILEINSYIHSNYPYEASDPSVSSINTVMATVHSAVKDACGSACNNLTTVPVIDPTTLTTDSEVIIGLSATIQIPTLSLSRNRDLSNEARKQIKLIRREGAVEGAEDVHMEFIAHVYGRVGAEGSTLDNVDMLFSSVFDKAAMVKGTLTSFVTGVTGPVGMGMNGKPFFNSDIDVNSLNTFASSFTSASATMSEKEGMTLPSLIQLNDRPNSKTISQLFGDLAASLPRGTSLSISEYFDFIRSFVYGDLEDAGVIPFLSLDYDHDSITVDLTFVSVRRVGFEASGVSWAKNVPISRTELTLQLSTRVSFTVASTTTFNLFEIIGYSRSQDFSLPIRSGMRVGLATAGNAETVVNLPSYSYVTVSFSGSMERGSTFNGIFIGNLSVSDPDTPIDSLFSFSMTEDNRGDYSQEAEPSATLAAFGDHFMFPSYIADHQLRSAISPLTKPLNEIIDFQTSWRDNTAWVFSSEAFPYVFVASVTFPFSGFTETVNFSVNSDLHFDNCLFNIPSATSIDDLISSMSGAVSQCGTLSSLVVVDFTGGEDGDYTVVMTPQYAGSLYSFVVTAPEKSQSIMQSQSWSASRVTPDHLSWHDLYDGIYLAILKNSAGYAYSEPQLINVSVADANLVDPSRQQFYPAEIPSVFFPASWSFHNPPKKVAIDSNFGTTDDTVGLKVAANSTVVEGDVAVSMVFGMSLWCSLGDGSLPMSTSFTSVDGNRYDQVKVPDAPDNTFTFVATAEKRSSSSVGDVPPLQTWTQTITLTPGKLLLDALVDELPGQLTDLSVHMITVERYQDSAYPDYVQALIKFIPFQPDSDTLYMPLEFKVNPTSLIAFGSSSSYSFVKAMTSCPLTKDYKLNINLDTSSSIDGDVASIGLGDSVESVGTVGIAEIASSDAKLILKQQFSASSVNSISLLGDMHNVIADKELFSDWYDTLATVSSVLTVQNISFNVSRNLMSDLASESISLEKSASAPFNKLKEVLPQFFNVAISTEKPTGRALKSLSTTNKKTFCSGLNMTLEKLTDFVACDSMNQNVPFTNQHLAPIYSTLINGNVEKSMNSVCDVTNDHIKTLSNFCEELNSKFGFNICGDSVLSDEGLDIHLLMNPGTVFAPAAFQFDTERFTNTDLSTGFGNSGDLMLETNLSANVGMKVVFLQRNTSDDSEYYAEPEMDVNQTSFSAKASVESAPTVKTSLGSTVVTFDANNLNVNMVITGAISANSDDINVILDGSAAFDAQTQNDDSTYTCHLQAQVPVLQHFFHRPANALEDTVKFSDSCLQGDFVSSVGDSMDDMTLAHYFEQDPSLFFKQFNDGLAKDLFDYLLDYVTDKAVAFLGKKIQAVCSKALDNIVGPAVASQIGNELTDMVSNIIKSGQFPNATDLERVVLQTFSGILNKVFGKYLTQPINTPQPGTGNYTWQFRFGTTTTKELNNIDWSCGDHGYADLEFKSMPQLTLQWTADFDVMWSKSKGISVQWPVSPAFSGKIQLDGNQLELSGSLLYLTADLTGAATVNGVLSSNPAQKDINFNVDASLNTQGKLGLVSKIRQETKGDKANALGALPYVSAGIQATWQFNWGTQNPKPTTPSSFKFTEPQLCLGSLITEFMQQVSREVDRIIKPLEPVFGPDGILLKPIPGLSKILGDHCNVLSILEWTCEMFSSSCNVATVRTLINVLNDIASDMEKIKQFMTVFDDPQGCMDFGYLYKTFKVDWNKDQPTPEDPDAGGDIPMTPEEKFNDTITEDQRNSLRDLMAKWSSSSVSVIPSNCANCTELNATFGTGKFGFHLDILEDFPVKLIGLLLGANIPLMSVSFPEASMSYSIGWTIPVWYTPYIAVNIYASATLSFQPPPVALMSDGIIDTVKTGNPSHLFRNLAVCTNSSFATGTLEVDGGAEGGISIVVAKVTVNFDITVKFLIEAKVANFGDGDWVTFDSILMQVHNHGFNGAIQFSLQLRGGFSLYLRGCVNCIVWKKCKKIVSWSWDTTLWSWEPNTPVLNSVASSDGTIDTDTVSFTYISEEPSSSSSTHIQEYESDGITASPNDSLPTYIITNSAIMMMPYNINEGAAALTRKLPPNVGVTWSSKESLCSVEYSVIVDGDITRPTMLMPDCNKVHVTIKQKGYRTVQQFMITSGAVVPLPRSSITINTAAHLNITEPLDGVQYSFSGSPSCPLVLETGFGSSINFTGVVTDYRGPVTITGNLQTIYWMISCDNVNIQSTSISCSSLTVTIPEGVNVIKVAASASPQVAPGVKLWEPVNITVNGSPSVRAVEIVSVNALVSVVVPDMKSMKGTVSVVGNSNDNNFIHVDMDTPADRDIIATAYPTHLSYNDSDDSDAHIIRHANVNVRSYSMKAAAGRKSTMHLIPPEGYEKVTIDMLGASNAVLRNEIDGCDRGSEVNVKMYNEGTHTLVLGSNGKLKDIKCDVDVGSDGLKNENSIREILVNASLDDRELVWEFNNDHFMVSDRSNTNDFFRVFTAGLNHVSVHFSEIGSSELSFSKNYDDGIEYAFLFPEESENGGLNSVEIPETHSPIFLNGPVLNLVLGDVNGCVTPLSKIGAVVVAPSGSNIIMNSQATNSTTHIAIQDNCVFEEQSASVPRPSDWFISMMNDLGVVYKEDCNLLVPKISGSDEGFSTTIDITAGSGADSLDATNPVVNVVANMGAGDDVVSWLSPESNSRLFLQMGDGADTLYVQSIGPVYVDLGNDDKPDHVNVLCKDVSPSILHSSVFPIGVRSDARMEISQWDSADIIEITRFDLEAPHDRDSAILSPDVDGGSIIYQMNHNTDYHVKKCKAGTSFSFTSSCSGFNRAVDANVEVALETYDDDCTVAVDSAVNTEGSVVLGVDSNTQTLPSEMRLIDSSAVFGKLNLTLGDVDHFGVVIPPAFTDEGKLTISGAPAKSEVFINIPSWTTSVGPDVKDIAIMTAFGNSEIVDLKEDNGLMFIVLGNSEQTVDVEMGSSSMKKVDMVNGCVKSSKTRKLSKWMLNNAKSVGFTLRAQQNCSALFVGAHFLTLTGDVFETVQASGLGWNTVRSLLVPPSVLNVVLEEVNTETKGSLWTGCSIVDYEFIISKMSNDAFHVRMLGTKSTLTVASPVFASSASVTVECTDPSKHHTWNVALPRNDKSIDSRYVYTDMNFTSNGTTCSGRINSGVCADNDSAPRIRLGKGLGGSVFVETSSPKNSNIFTRYVNVSNSDGLNQIRLRSFDNRLVEAQIVWDDAYTTGMKINLADRSENVIFVSDNATDKHPLYLSASVLSGLSFSNVGNHTISFEGVQPAHFNVATHSFDLLGGLNSTNNVFCFTPCDMCSSETWNEIRTYGTPCSLQADVAAACSASAHIHVSQGGVPAVLSVSCSQPSWDPSTGTECALAYNANGADDKSTTNVIPFASQTIAGIITVVSASASVLSASVILSRVLIALTRADLPDVNKWWVSNIMRDFYNDQFSWASVVLTACIGGISDYDISNWNGAVDGLVLEVKSLIFGWLNLCNSAYSPVVIIIWMFAIAVLVMRMLTVIGNIRDTMSWRRALRVLDPIHAIVSSITLVLLPVAGYAVGVTMSVDAFVGIITLAAGICMVACIPVATFTNMTLMRNIASYIAVSLPFVMSIISGAGASRSLVLSFILIFAVALPLCNTFVLWKSFFAGGDSRKKQWKSSLFSSFGLRAASLICGLVFVGTLFFDLNVTASGISYAFWFLWVFLPWLQLIPLVINARHSNIVQRWSSKSGYSSINGETTPLRSSVPDESASLQSVSSMSSTANDKDMSAVAGV